MYLMKEVCEKTKITYDTLKYYCNEGLIPDVKRDEQNRRVFDDMQVEWIINLKCLKKCGMSIKEMKLYLDLVMQGEQTVAQRIEMLNQKLEDLYQRQKETQESINFIQHKKVLYKEMYK